MRAKSLMMRAKSTKRRAKPQRKKSGLTVSNLILKAVSASTEPHGISLADLKKVLQAGGYDVARSNARVLNTIRRLVAKKALVQITGTSGSFKKSPRRSSSPMRSKSPMRSRSPRRSKSPMRFKTPIRSNLQR
ncbi:protamine-like protein [Pleuronectes platessa]|uniref:protamine-like protein n=1 Tax=Pleuronectes platessa TaxID=8262 RepID=UPI00232A416F|nr:protamine-like protein [Pleuronectes platessa]